MDEIKDKYIIRYLYYWIVFFFLIFVGYLVEDWGL